MFGTMGKALQTHPGHVHVEGRDRRAACPSSSACRARSCRSAAPATIGKQDMVRNDATPVIEVDPETYRVTVDGEPAHIEPAATLPLTQLFFLV